MLRIIRRTLKDNQIAWDLMLNSALWSDKVTPKRSIGNSPYKLVYGKEARIPIYVGLPTLDLLHQMELLENEPLQIRYPELMELQELRDKAYLNMEKNKKQMKKTFDKKSKFRVFNEGDIVLNLDADRTKPRRHSKFDTLWSGPYIISACKEYIAFQLSKLNGEELPIPMK
ncbi:hypothetical protein KI387_005002, partial [Taxus chinensis]